MFFCRAVLESIRLLHLQVDVVHCHDWQTALIPAYLKIEYRHMPGYENIATLLTIHNLAYQGMFWHWDMLLTGLDWKYFNWQPDGVLRQAEPAEDRAGLCRLADDGQPDVCRGDSDRRAWAAGWRACCSSAAST